MLPLRGGRVWRLDVTPSRRSAFATDASVNCCQHKRVVVVNVVRQNETCLLTCFAFFYFIYFSLFKYCSSGVCLYVCVCVAVSVRAEKTE